MNRETRRRVGLLLLVIAGAVLYFGVSPHVPRDQTLHVILGAAAPAVTEIAVRYAPHRSGKAPGKDRASDEDWTREATFRFPEGSAPRVVTHQPRLADGDYDVEIDIQTPSQRSSIERRVTLAGGTTSIDLSEAVPR